MNTNNNFFVIVGAPGGGTSFFTKFLRYNGFYAGRSIEEGRDDKEHLGYLYNRKWHESLTYGDSFCKQILEQLGVDNRMYEKLFTIQYRELIDTVKRGTEESLQYFVGDNLDELDRMYEDEFPDTSIPHGFKNPRNFLLLPYIKKAYPFAKILTVQRSMNPNPSNQGPEGLAFAQRIGNNTYSQQVYGHKDDFRFQFEDFDNAAKVNELLKFVGLKTLTPTQLKEQLFDLDFEYNKIGK